MSGRPRDASFAFGVQVWRVAAQCRGSDDVLLVCPHLTTSGKAVRCVGLCSALRWLMQCAAMANAARCLGWQGIVREAGQFVDRVAAVCQLVLCGLLIGLMWSVDRGHVACWLVSCGLLIGILVASGWASFRLLKKGAEASRGGIRCAVEEIPEQVSGGGFRCWYFLEKGFCGFLPSVGKVGAGARFA